MTKSPDSLDDFVKQVVSHDDYVKSPETIISGTVVSVDESELVAIVRPLAMETSREKLTYEVSLKCFGEGNLNGMYVIPEVGSRCFIASVDVEDNRVLLWAEKVKEIRVQKESNYVKILISETEISIDAKVKKISVNGESDAVVMAKKLETKLNAFIQVFNQHTHPTAGSGPPSAPSSPASSFSATDIQSSIVKIGS